MGGHSTYKKFLLCTNPSTECQHLTFKIWPKVNEASWGYHQNHRTLQVYVQQNTETSAKL
jgi:hypothetical protein